MHDVDGVGVGGCQLDGGVAQQAAPRRPVGSIQGGQQGGADPWQDGPLCLVTDERGGGDLRVDEVPVQGTQERPRLSPKAPYRLARASPRSSTRSWTEVAPDATRPDDVILSLGEAFYGQVVDTEVSAVLEYVNSRIAPLLTVARWAAVHPGALTSITLVGGYVPRKPVTGMSAWAFIGSGIVALVESLAVELAPTRVNEVAPTMIIDSPRGDP